MKATAPPLFLIVDREWQQPTDTCAGPDGSGKCPKAIEGRLIPCAGRQLFLLNSDLSSKWSRSVAANEDECPVPYLVAGGA